MSGRDILAHDIYLRGYIILILSGLLLVIFTIAAVCIPYISYIHSTGI
jgi:hypothetical protein